MARLTDLVLRHRLLVVLFWLGVAFAGMLTSKTTTDRLTQTFTLPGSTAAAAEARIAQEYHSGSGNPNIVVFTLPAGQSVDTPGVREALTRAGAATERLGTRVVDYPSTGDRAFVTADGHTAYALVFVSPRGGDSTTAMAAPLEQAARSAAPPDWHIAVTGTGPLAQAPKSGGGNGLLAETLIGALGALIVLVFVFASFVAILPLMMAAVSILSTFLLMLAMTGVIDVNFIASYVIGLIGLGVAIDYSLLVVTRWREERAHGADNRTRWQTAMAQAGRAVCSPASPSPSACSRLLVLPVPALRSFGYAGALIPLVSVAVSVTLLPVLLDTIGPRWTGRGGGCAATTRRAGSGPRWAASSSASGGSRPPPAWPPWPCSPHR